MKYLLDTDHISFLQRRSSPEFTCLIARMREFSSDDFTTRSQSFRALSIVSFHEQVLGAHNFINRAQTNTDTIRGYSLLLEIFQGFKIAPILLFDAGAVAVFNDLRKQKIRVSTMDLRIAAIAISHDLVLLTRNVKDFSKIPNLLTENWTL